MWNILEIEQTTDLRQIKKAYARLLKKTSPEEDPEGFQVLRQAYEQAQGYVKAVGAETVKENLRHHVLPMDPEPSPVKDEITAHEWNDDSRCAYLRDQMLQVDPVPIFDAEGAAPHEWKDDPRRPYFDDQMRPIDSVPFFDAEDTDPHECEDIPIHTYFQDMQKSKDEEADPPLAERIERLHAFSSPGEWVTLLQERRGLSFEEQAHFEMVLVQHLCQLGDVDDRPLLWRIPNAVVNLLDEEFHWRTEDLHLQKWIGSEESYALFCQRLHRVVKPTQEELLTEILELLCTSESSTSLPKWEVFVRRAELMPRERRLAMGDAVFDLLLRSVTDATSQPLDEGLNALDRLFHFTLSEKKLRGTYKKILNGETKFLEHFLPQLRVTVANPLTDVGYEKELIHKTFRFTFVFLKFLLKILFVILCFCLFVYMPQSIFIYFAFKIYRRATKTP